MFKKILLIMLFVLPMIFITVNAQRTYDMFDIYLQPSVMEEDGSISVAVRIRNIERVDVANFDGILSIAFELNVDTTAFIIANEPVSITDNTLISYVGDIAAEDIGGTLSFSWSDMSNGERLITRDGHLANINIRARNPHAFFHSADVFPLTFNREKIEVITLNLTTNQVRTVGNIHTWNVNIGGQVFPVVLPPLRVSIAEYVEINSETVPVRLVAENFGASVQWRALDRKAIIATVDNLIIEITENSDIMLVNGIEIQMETPAFIYDNRLLIDSQSASVIFPLLVLYEFYEH